MNLLFSPQRPLQSSQTAAPPPSAQRMQAWHAKKVHGISRIPNLHFDRLLEELVDLHTLDIRCYDGDACFHSRLPWQVRRVEASRFLLRSEDSEINMNPPAWGHIFAICTSYLARPGFYIYDPQDRLIASLTVRSHRELWQLNALVSRLQSLPLPSKRPKAQLREPPIERKGYGPRTQAGSRVHQLQTHYPHARVARLMHAAPHSASQIATQDLGDFVALLASQEYPLGIIHGSPAFWQYSTLTAEELPTQEQDFLLRGQAFELRSCAHSFAEAWLVRSAFRGTFAYSLLGYNARLRLGVMALLPETHLALSVSSWRNFLLNFEPCTGPELQ